MNEPRYYGDEEEIIVAAKCGNWKLVWAMWPEYLEKFDAATISDLRKMLRNIWEE